MTRAIAAKNSRVALGLLVLCLAGCAPDKSTSADAEHAAGGAAADMPVVRVAIGRSGLSDVGADKPLDYADPRLWLCRPGNDPDECDANLDATALLPDGTRKRIVHVKAPNPEIDCFYVYPTVKLTSGGPMTDFAHIDITLDPLLSQGAALGGLQSRAG
ncbi:MAG: hypothetical protein RL701_6536 [Pseudomonadota bacterium]|jgi:hypothetical protein